VKTSKRNRPERLLERLYGARDRDAFYPELARLLREEFGAESCSIFLNESDGGSRQEWDSTLPGEKSQSHALRYEGEEIGQLLVSPPLFRVDSHFPGFLRHVSRVLFQFVSQSEQERLVEDSLRQVEALNALGQLLHELDSERILNRVLKFCMDLTGAEVGAARLYEKDKVVHKVFWGLPEEVLDELDQDEREPLRGSRLRQFSSTGNSAWFPDTLMEVNLPLRLPHRAELLLVSGPDFQEDPQSRELIESCALFGSQALQKALEHQEQILRNRELEQLEVARQIQKRLIPEILPEVEGLDMAGYSQSAESVGGDYYDVITLDNGDTLAFLADVSGKGVPAALRMSGLRALLRSQARSCHSPGELLGRLNRFLCEDRMKGSFVTATCLIFRCGGREVLAASAGHEPVLFLRQGKKLQDLGDYGGLPLGIREREEYRDQPFRFEAGDWLLLYSDGATDMKSEDSDRYGSARLEGYFQKHRGTEAADLLGSLLDDLNAFRGRIAPVDDLTLLIFQGIEQ
jgi:serine phosphatase RsbU (regulator of sigma subunit)